VSIKKVLFVFRNKGCLVTVIVIQNHTERVRKRSIKEAEVGHTPEHQGKRDLDHDPRIEGKREVTPEIEKEAEVAKEREAEIKGAEAEIEGAEAETEGAEAGIEGAEAETKEAEIAVGEGEVEAERKTEGEVIQGLQMFQSYLK